MLAVMFRPQYFDLLLRAGANPKRDRSRLLAAATMRGRTDFVTRLVAAGANVNASDVDGQTPLIWALGRTPSCVKLLLDHGANPNVVNVRQRTPLDLAAEAGDASAVRLLLAHGANVNVRPARAHTALYWARKKRHLDVVTLLQQAGATLDQ
jgi:ankyrin repeat protein